MLYSHHVLLLQKIRRVLRLRDALPCPKRPTRITTPNNLGSNYFCILFRTTIFVSEGLLSRGLHLVGDTYCRKWNNEEQKSYDNKGEVMGASSLSLPSVDTTVERGTKCLATVSVPINIILRGKLTPALLNFVSFWFLRRAYSMRKLTLKKIMPLGFVAFFVDVSRYFCSKVRWHYCMMFPFRFCLDGVI